MISRFDLKISPGTKAAKEQLEARWADKETMLTKLQTQFANAGKGRNRLREQVQHKEVVLAAAAAKHDAQTTLVADLKGFPTNQGDLNTPGSESGG